MNKKKYQDYTITELLQDEDFLRWVNQSQKTDDAFWAAFLMEQPEQREKIARARALLEELGGMKLQEDLRAEEKTAMLAAMKARIGKPGPQLRPVRKRRTVNWQVMAVAASVLLLILAGWWFWSGPSMVTFETAYGERATVDLPDGSRVALNANSTLQFAENWDEREDRRVWLTGEAFFEVEKNRATGQKFQVITEDLTVEVLGTVFNVNSRHEETEVFLEEGSISLSLDGLQEEMLLQPGETIVYSEKSRQLPEKRMAEAQLHTSWTDGFLFFSETPLREVLEKVADIYGVRFQMQDTAHYSRRLNTAVPIGNLKEAITVIGTTLKLEFRETGDHYQIGTQSE
jgi:ferric-dicitrate binding protein FerR (iron transport regulator)